MATADAPNGTASSHAARMSLWLCEHSLGSWDADGAWVLLNIEETGPSDSGQLRVVDAWFHDDNYPTNLPTLVSFDHWRESLNQEGAIQALIDAGKLVPFAGEPPACR
jgi:hypothetical protein